MISRILSHDSRLRENRVRSWWKLPRTFFLWLVMPWWNGITNCQPKSSKSMIDHDLSVVFLDLTLTNLATWRLIIVALSGIKPTVINCVIEWRTRQYIQKPKWRSMMKHHQGANANNFQMWSTVFKHYEIIRFFPHFQTILSIFLLHAQLLSGPLPTFRMASSSWHPESLSRRRPRRTLLFRMDIKQKTAV